MAYVVKWTSQGLQGIAGKANINIADNTFNNTSTSLTLTGKGLKNYGLFQQENFLRLLENFASNTAPTNPTIGQMWYHSTEKIPYVYTGTDPNFTTYFGGWRKVTNSDVQTGLSEYNLVANLLNKVIGAPSYIQVLDQPSMVAADTAYGWGQTDLVPVYSNTTTLSAASVTAQSSLPSGFTFPSTYNNNAWTILLARLRKALRQVNISGLKESDVSTIGFLNDGTGSNTYSNWLNNLNAGLTPYQGTVANFSNGIGSYGNSGIAALIGNTLSQINQLKSNPNRFSLSYNSTTQQQVGTISRTNPSQSLTVPMPLGTYKLLTTLTFASEAAMLSFFNAGGQVRFNFGFNPSSGSPTDIELDWKRFLARLDGLTLDYQGLKLRDNYQTPLEGQSIANTMGFYGLKSAGSATRNLLTRNVLSTLASSSLYSVYAENPPTDGGIVVDGRVRNIGATYYLDVWFDFYLQRVVNGSPAEQDTTSNTLVGSMFVNTSIIRANNLNTNSPAISNPAYSHSGTFTQLF